MTRREALRSAAAFGAAAFVPQTVFGANERVNLGVMGVRGRGRGLAQQFAALPGARVKFVCDVDARVLPDAIRLVEAGQKSAPETCSDFRRMLDDKEIDGVVVATPDHWHALATIHACAAGKDVYVEKPCSHNVREGRAMIGAARKSNRIVQVGTQRRSSTSFSEAIALLRAGKIGKVRVAKAINCQRRANIGKKSDGGCPPEVNYDLWLGPAPKRPFNENRFHYNWHWHWDYGTGDLGNDGVHHVDVARWGLGAGAPSRVASSGAKLHFDDDQQTPDTQTAVFEYPGMQLHYEMRLWTPYGEHGFENGNVFYGEGGYMVLGDHGWRLYDEKGKLSESGAIRTRGDREHLENFLDCIRTRRTPACDIEEGHLSALHCHLGNIGHRTGRTLAFDPTSETIPGDSEASRLLGRSYRPPWSLPRIG